jgi:hypothetical protein
MPQVSLKVVAAAVASIAIKIALGRLPPAVSCDFAVQYGQGLARGRCPVLAA